MQTNSFGLDTSQSRMTRKIRVNVNDFTIESFGPNEMDSSDKLSEKENRKHSCEKIMNK